MGEPAVTLRVVHDLDVVNLSVDDEYREERRHISEVDVGLRDFFQVKEDTAVIRHDMKGVQASIQVATGIITSLTEKLTKLEVEVAQHSASPGHPGLVDDMKDLRVEMDTLNQRLKAEIHSNRKEVREVNQSVQELRTYIAKAAGIAAALSAVVMTGLRFIDF